MLTLLHIPWWSFPFFPIHEKKENTITQRNPRPQLYALMEMQPVWQSAADKNINDILGPSIVVATAKSIKTK